MRNSRGFSLIEALIALGMVSFIACALGLGLFEYKKIIKKSQSNHVIEKQIKEIVENIRPNINLYQINYDSSKDALDRALDVNKLPMAWGPGKSVMAKDCASCPGRFGFTVQPFPNWPGLYILTLRMTHTDWSSYRDYTFLVTTK